MGSMLPPPTHSAPNLKANSSNPPQALLDVMAESPGAQSDMAEGVVLNVNVPGRALKEMKGLKMTHQGTGCFFPHFKEIDASLSGPELPQIEEHTEETRMFRNQAGGYRQDGTDGSDMSAVAAGFVSVCPLGLRSDLLFKVRGGAGAACGCVPV